MTWRVVRKTVIKEFPKKSQAEACMKLIEVGKNDHLELEEIDR